MAVQVYNPQVSVMLFKNIGRALVAGGIPASQRFQGTKRTIDLTPYLGEMSSVVMAKSVRQPAGMFSITLVDNISVDQGESLYGLIEPMDFVEIRMARDQSIYAGSGLPLLMRGIIGSVSRSEEMSGDGRPTRLVTISGQDYGMLLQINQISYLPGAVTGAFNLTYFKLFQNYGVTFDQDQTASQFVNAIITQVVNNNMIPAMKKAAQQNGVAAGYSPLLNFAIDASVPDGLVSPIGVNGWPGGTVYSLLAYFGDVGPWNELYVEDRGTGPTVVFRPQPFRSAAGAWLQEPYISTASKRPAFIAVHDYELMSLSVERSHGTVYNYFWVDNPSYSLAGAPVLQAYAVSIAEKSGAAAATLLLSDYPNASPALYGFRPMQLQTQQGRRYDSQPALEVAEKDALTVDWMTQRRKALIANNQDNIVFEAGSMRLRGNEQILPGNYVQLIRGTNGGFVQEMYAHTVTHEFLPYRNYTTSVEFDRGTGFIVRAQRSNQGAAAPYYAEIDVRGVYSAPSS